MLMKEEALNHRVDWAERSSHKDTRRLRRPFESNCQTTNIIVELFESFKVFAPPTLFTVVYMLVVVLLRQ